MKNHIPPTNIFFGEIAIKNLLKKEKKMKKTWTLFEAACFLERSKKLSNDCVKCDYFNECQGGCMNEAIEHTGDVFGKTHYCGTWKTVFGKIDNAIQTHGISNIEKWIERITP